LLRFAFWNLNRKRLDNLVVDLVKQEQIDILLLAEAPGRAGELVRLLNDGTTPASAAFAAPFVRCDAIVLVMRFLVDFARPIHESLDGFTIQELKLPARPPILLVAAHMPSKLHARVEEQTFGAEKLANYIDQAESKVSHRRTILVGDFNMNPFEPGMAMAGALNGVMTRSIAERGQRTVGRKQYPFFYNPMWSRFGDANPGPAGTYYHGKGQLTHFWNMFDQVLIRPELLPYFDSDRLRIVDRIGSTSLTTLRGTPNSSLASDHLPIVFELNL
jgi:endonuclease/exonuclease/phosphatase family metal-dependent hydrolase